MLSHIAKKEAEETGIRGKDAGENDCSRKKKPQKIYHPSDEVLYAFMLARSWTWKEMQTLLQK